MRIDRRTFGRASLVGLAASLPPRQSSADDAVSVTNPRATDGDDRYEPDWEQRLTVTVGRKDADLVGNDDRVLQAAVDYVGRIGGGTVKVMPGIYTLRAAVVLPSGIRLIGSGPESVLTRIPSHSAQIVADSDWYDQEITVADRGDLRVGDGIAIQATNPDTQAPFVIKRTIIARSGNRFKLSDGLRDNVWLSGQPTCSSLFPLLTSERTSNVLIEDMVLDGNRENVANFNGNHAGCIFLQDCTRHLIRRVETRNFNGDGISFQVCHDVHLEDCYSHGNADLGLHPGSGSQRPVIRNCRLENNGIGLFWCWGVRHGLAEKNRIVANRDYGVSIGHNDTDNVMRHNEVIDSGKVGILFRDDARGEDFWANRNTVENNLVHNSGGDDGIAIDIQGKTKDLQITGNAIRETRAPARRIGIRISSQSKKIRIDKNQIEGFARQLVDRRHS